MISQLINGLAMPCMVRLTGSPTWRARLGEGRKESCHGAAFVKHKSARRAPAISDTARLCNV